MGGEGGGGGNLTPWPPLHRQAMERGRKAITAETALQLEEALALPALMWLRLEAEHQLFVARERRFSA